MNNEFQARYDKALSERLAIESSIASIARLN